MTADADRQRVIHGRAVVTWGRPFYGSARITANAPVEAFADLGDRRGPGSSTPSWCGAVGMKHLGDGQVLIALVLGLFYWLVPKTPNGGGR